MGGAEKAVLEISKKIPKDDFNVFILGLSNRAELYNEFIKNDLNTVILNKTNSLKDFIEIVNYINKFVRKHDIHIIHAHMTHAVIVASFIKLLNPHIKVVFTSHSENIGSKIREILLFLLKPLRNVDILLSERIKKFFIKQRYKIIPNGIDINIYQIKLRKNSVFTFIAVGRLEKVKNHIELLKIANELKRFYKFKLLIIGEGSLRSELENFIKEYSLENTVKLLGLRNDVPKLLNKAHCFVMPSLWEGLPISLLEAGASRLPVISTPVGSILDICNNENSYVTELADFKKNMMKVMNDYQHAVNKAMKLFCAVKNKYSINYVVEQHIKLYKELYNEQNSN